MNKIPSGIKRDHILKAIDDFNGGFEHEFHESTEYDLIHDKRRYPPKAIVGLAARYILGKTLKPKDFSGGLKSKCFRVLEKNGFTILSKPKEIGFWIFQTNPDKYDIDLDLAKNPEEAILEIKTHKHRKEIRVGDRVFIWRASGAKANAGIIASSTVIALPGEIVDGLHKPKNSSYWIKNKSNNKHFCKLKIEDLRITPEEGMLARSLVSSDDILRSLAIVTRNVGGTFKIDQDEYKRISSYWDHLASISEDIDESNLRNNINDKTVYFEGKVRELSSKHYERSSKAREDCLKIHGYDCAVCSLNFEDRYGEIGKKFIHVHHIDPVASRIGEYEVNPEKDLIPLCPNCHAMIHRKTPPYKVDDLKKLINN